MQRFSKPLHSGSGFPPEVTGRLDQARAARRAVQAKDPALFAAAEALGLKLLQSVREMNAGISARVTQVELNDVAQARQSTGLSQAQFAEALNISKRTL